MPVPTIWHESHRADPFCCAVADRHYSRQKIGSPQFVPPGRCYVLKNEELPAVWVTSWPFAQYVKHAWAGAWVNSFFRNEGEAVSSHLIRAAIRLTAFKWTPPEEGLVTFIDPQKVPAKLVQGLPTWGYAYKRAGFSFAGLTKGGLHAWHMDVDGILQCALGDP